MDVYTAIYVILALAGTFVYNYAGYLKFGKPNGESYDYSKFLDTLLKGGFASTLVTVAAYAAFGLDPIYLFLAFANGMLFSAGIDKLSAALENGKPKVNLQDAIAKLTEAVGKLLAEKPQ